MLALARGLLRSGGAVVKVDPGYLDVVSMPVSSSPISAVETQCN